MIDIFGFAAAILTTISFVPQAWLIIRTRNTQGISLTMYSLFTIGVACWLIYGVMKGEGPIVAANAITLALAMIILGYKALDTFRAK
jgi:MtN3 and saliva related transmembrane protein